MNDNGYIYVLMNPSIPDLVKIGKTTRCPKERAKELSSTTGIPTPFVVVYEEYFKSCTEAEKFVHTYLENQGYRKSENREFFESSMKESIDAVIKAKEHFGEFLKKENTLLDGLNEDISVTFTDLEELASKYMNGEDDFIKNEKKAIEYYNKAIKLGSIESLYELAMYYANIPLFMEEDNEKRDLDKAIEYFNLYLEKKKSYVAYVELANIYRFKRETENSLKIYNKMFNDSRNFDLATFSDINSQLTFNSIIRNDFSLDVILDEELNYTFYKNLKVIESLYDRMVKLFEMGEKQLTSALERSEVINDNNLLVATKSSLDAIEEMRNKYFLKMESLLKNK